MDSDSDNDQPIFRRHLKQKRQIQDLTSDSEDEMESKDASPREKSPRSQCASPRVRQHGGPRNGAGAKKGAKHKRKKALKSPIAKKKAQDRNKGPRSKNWCLTGFVENIKKAHGGSLPTLEDYYNENHCKIRYICGKLEKGEEKDDQGLVHYQAFVHFKSIQRATAVLKIFPSEQWQNGAMYKNSTVDACIEYTQKLETAIEGEDWVEYGERPAGQGHDSELQQAIDCLKDGGSMGDIYREFARVAVLHGQQLRQWWTIFNTEEPEAKHEIKDFQKDPHPWGSITDEEFKKTLILYGEANTGKSAYVRANFQAHGWSWIEVQNPDDLAKYNNHDAILFDDIDGWAQDLNRTDVLNIVEHEDNRSIRIRYANVLIPGHVKKVIVSNDLRGIVFDYKIMREAKSVQRRIVGRHLRGSQNPGDNAADLWIPEEDPDHEAKKRRVEGRHELEILRLEKARAEAQPMIDDVFEA